MAILCRLKRRQVSWRNVSGGPSRSSAARWGGFSSLITDSRIKPGVNNIGQDLKSDDCRSNQEENTHYQGRIPIRDTIQEQAPHAGPGKDAFGDHSPCQKQGQVEANDGYQGQRSVFEGMSSD